MRLLTDIIEVFIDLLRVGHQPSEREKYMANSTHAFVLKFVQIQTCFLVKRLNDYHLPSQPTPKTTLHYRYIWPQGYKTFFMLSLVEHEISTAY